MNISKSQQKKVEQILIDLINSKTFFSEEIFEKLCLCFNNNDIEFIYKHLMNQGDTQSVYWLIRYLVKLDRPLAYEKLYMMSESDNLIIRQEVCLGIKNIDRRERPNLLLLLINSKWKDNVSFAAKQIGELRVSRALNNLVDALEKYKDDADVAISLIKGLGNIRDRRAISVLEKFLEVKNEDVLNATLRSLGVFEEIYHHKYFDRWLLNKNLKVKEFVYLKILQQKNESWQIYLAKSLFKERKESLKISILSSLRSIEVKPLFEMVLLYALYDRSFSVRMLAQSILKRVRSDKLLQWTLEKEKEIDDEHKILILRNLAAYSKSVAVFDVFKRNFLESKSKKVRLMSLDYLGRIKDERVIPFLIDLVKQDDAFAYAATISLTYAMTPKNWSIINEVLLLDLEKRELSVQVFLKFLLRFPVDYSFPDFIEKTIHQLSQSISPHIRYLTTKLILKTKKSDKLYMLLNIYQSDSNEKVKQAAQEGVFEYINLYPQEMLAFLSVGINDRKFISLVSSVLKRTQQTKENYVKILNVLLGLIIQNFDDDKNKIMSDVKRLMVLLRQHMIKQKFLFLDVFSRRKWKEKELWMLMKIINLTDLHEVKGHSFDFMATQYEGCALEVKSEFLAFFAKMKTKSQLIEEAVFRDLAYENDDVLIKKVNKTIDYWFGQSLEQHIA